MHPYSSYFEKKIVIAWKSHNYNKQSHNCHNSYIYKNVSVTIKWDFHPIVYPEKIVTVAVTRVFHPIANSLEIIMKNIVYWIFIGQYLIISA